MASELVLVLCACSWQALARVNQALEGSCDLVSLRIQKQSLVIEKQGTTLQEHHASRKGLRRQLHQPHKYCASQASALTRATDRSTAMKGHIVELEAAAAQVGCCVTMLRCAVLSRL